jgi:hypothetical protein
MPLTICMHIGRDVITIFSRIKIFFIFRICDEKRNIILADCDDDGETGASSRMLHLMDVRKK